MVLALDVKFRAKGCSESMDVKSLQALKFQV